MSFKNSLKHRIFRRLSESDMVAASARYESHEEAEQAADPTDSASNALSNSLHSNYETSTPATQRHHDADNANLSSSSQKAKLKPGVLKLTDLIVFGICQVIGSGIYVLAGTAGKDFAGSGLFISFIIGAISAGASAICYAEFASRIPVIGGSYMYTYYSSGEMIGFISGFLTFLRGFVALGGNAVGWTGYFKSFLIALDEDADTLTDDNRWTSYLFGHTFGTNSSVIHEINLLAPFVIFILGLVSAYGIRASANFMSLFATWNVSLIFFFVVSGMFLFDMKLFTNPCGYPEFGNVCDEDVNKDAFLPYGIDGVFAASGLAFWAYVGLEGIASVAEETVNPKRDVPRAIYCVLFIVAALYLSVSIVLLGMVPFQSLDEDAPLAQAFGEHNERLLQEIASFGAVSTITIVIFATLINRPRSLYRIALDGLLCDVCSYVNTTTQTPMVAIFTTAFLAMIVSTLFNIAEILQVSSVCALLQYAVVAGGVLIVRYAPPKQSINTQQNKDKKLIRSHDQTLESNDNSMDSMAIPSAVITAPSLVAVTAFWSYLKVFTVVWCWIISCLFTSFLIVERNGIIENVSKGFWYLTLCIGGTVLCSSFILIIYMNYTIPWKTYVSKEKFDKIVWTPFGPYLPMFAVAINSFIIASYRFFVFMRIFIAIIIGFIIYFLYGYNHSKLNQKENISSQLYKTVYGSNDSTDNNHKNVYDIDIDDHEYFSQQRALSLRSLSDDMIEHYHHLNNND